MLRKQVVVLLVALAALPLGAEPKANEKMSGTVSVVSKPAWIDASARTLEAELVAKHGEQVRPRLARGLAQVTGLWRESDGNASAFEAFVRENFAADDVTQRTMLERMDFLHEQLDGCMLEMGR